MSYIPWNCRDLLKDTAKQDLREIIKSYNPDMILLVETMVKQYMMERMRRKFEIFGSFFVDGTRISGGLCLCWKRGVRVNIIDYKIDFIPVRIKWEFGPFGLDSDSA